jgi:membrane protein required for colicin V production
MQTYDVIMLAVLALATLFGAWKGLAWQGASLSSIFLSYFIAYNFREPMSRMVNATPPWNMFLAMLILYLGSSLVIWLGFRFVSELISRVRLNEFDRHAGAVLGLARGVLWCVIITLFAFTLLGDGEKRAIVQSRSGLYIAKLLDKAEPIMPAELHQILAPYIQSLDAGLGQNPSLPGGPSDPTGVAGYGTSGGFPGGSPGGYPAANIPPAPSYYGGSSSYAPANNWPQQQPAPQFNERPDGTSAYRGYP